MLLILLLTIAGIALRITASGLELAYQVGKRSDSIRRMSETTAILATTESGTNSRKVAFGAKIGVDTLSTVVKATSRIAVSGSKAFLKLLSFILNRIRDDLLALQALVLVIDVVVFFILVSASAGYLTLFCSLDENGNITYNRDVLISLEASFDESKSTETELSVGNSDFTKYNLSSEEYMQLARLCQQEQGSVRGAAAEASLMCNLYESYRGRNYSSLTDYVRNSGWFARAGYYMDNGRASDDVLEVVKSVIRDGKRVLPKYVDSHDCFSDLSSVSNNGESFSVSDRSKYKKDITVCKNVYGATFIFYSFPDVSSDPFGYENKELKNQYGDDCYSIDILLLELGI